jgi:hypothetical protein
MVEALKTRRWFQVSLATILWLATVIALAVYSVNEHRLRVQAEVEARRVAALESECANLRNQVESLEQKMSSMVPGPISWSRGMTERDAKAITAARGEK